MKRLIVICLVVVAVVATGAFLWHNIQPDGAQPSTNRSQDPTDSSKNEYNRDATKLSYTDKAGVTSQYHLFGAHMDTPTGPRGVIIALHGDSDPETAPDWYTSAATDSEIKNYIDLARQHDLYLLVPRTPDRDGPQTWWNDDSSADWIMNLLTDDLAKKQSIDSDRIYFIGVSGGADSIAEDILSRHSGKFTGGGAAMIAGGSMSDPSLVLPTPSGFARFEAHWVVGSEDDGSDGSYDALSWSKQGEKFWRDRGLKTSHTIIPGGDHYDVGDDGTAILRSLLLRQDSSQTN